jgi:hypothetical protein
MKFDHRKNRRIKVCATVVIKTVCVFLRVAFHSIEKPSAVCGRLIKLIAYSLAPFSPTNHCSLFLNNTLKVVRVP